MERISPHIDIAFKKIFGVEENKDLLISLINAVVSEDDQVVDITLLNPYNQKNFHEDKLSILDIKAKGHHGKLFNIEIQLTDEADYDKRALYYWAKVYTDQLQNSEGYSLLTKVIGIHILNFVSIPNIEKYHNVFHIKEKESGLHYFKDLELHTIELKKFTKDIGTKFSDIADKIHTALDLWTAFLARYDLLNPNKFGNQAASPEVKKALSVLQIMNFNRDERELYEGRLKWFRTELGMIEKMEKQGFKKGEEKGMKAGLEKGLEQGREQGLEQGREQGIKKGLHQAALSMLDKGMSPGEISELIDLSSDEVRLLELSKKRSPIS